MATANGTSLTPRRWSITFLVGMGLKYSCKSILNKSHRCALAPLLNNILRLIFFFFNLLYCITLGEAVCTLAVCRAPCAVHRSAPRFCSSAAGLQCLRPQPGNTTAFPSPKSPTVRWNSQCFI